MITEEHKRNEDRNPRGIMAGFIIYDGAMRVEKPGAAAAPKSGGGFVLEDAGRELVMTQDCPEIGRERLRAKC